MHPRLELGNIHPLENFWPDFLSLPLLFLNVFLFGKCTKRPNVRRHQRQLPCSLRCISWMQTQGNILITYLYLNFTYQQVHELNKGNTALDINCLHVLQKCCTETPISHLLPCINGRCDGNWPLGFNQQDHEMPSSRIELPPHTDWLRGPMVFTQCAFKHNGLTMASSFWTCTKHKSPTGNSLWCCS